MPKWMLRLKRNWRRSENLGCSRMANETTALNAEKQTLLALRALRRRVEELEQERREPIAVVGMSCRIPGGVNDPESFWKLLQEKRSAVTEIPRSRIDL